MCAKLYMHYEIPFCKANYICMQRNRLKNKTQDNNIGCGRLWQIEFDNLMCFFFFLIYIMFIYLCFLNSPQYIYIIYPKKPRSLYPQNHSIARVITMSDLELKGIVERLKFFLHMRKLRTREGEEAYTRSYAWKIMKPVQKSVFMRL